MADSPLSFSAHDSANAMRESYKAVSDIANGGIPEGYREMNDFDRAMSGFATASQRLADASGFGQYYNDNGGITSIASPEGLGRFLVNLPVGMASGIPGGFANLVSAFTGDDYTYGSDLANNAISEEKYSLPQRLAAGVTGFIDTGGIALGGSGSALREINGARRLAQGLPKAGGLGNALTKFSGAGLAHSVPGMLAFDTLEEGVEEFVQSGAEDIMQGNDFDVQKALEAGAMGALGGTVMSGAALGVRLAAGNGTNAGNTNVRQPQQQQVWGKWAQTMAAGKNIEHVPEVFNEYAKKTAFRNQLNKVPGSINMMIVGDPSFMYGPNQVGAGLTSIRDVFNQTGGAQIISALFEINQKRRASEIDDADIAAMRAILYDTTKSDAEIAETLTQMILAANPEGKQIVLTKNPATKNGGAFAQIINIFAGDGLRMNPMAAQAVNADFDSDNMGTYLRTDIITYNPGRWMSELFYSPLSLDEANKDTSDEGGKAAVEFKFGAYSRRQPKQMLGRARHVATEIRNRLDSTTFGNNLSLVDPNDPTSIDLRNECVKRARKVASAASMTKDNRDAEIAKALQEFSEAIRNLYSYRFGANVDNAKMRRYIASAQDALYRSYADNKNGATPANFQATIIETDEAIAAAVGRAIDDTEPLKFTSTPGETNGRGPGVKREETGMSLFYGETLSSQVFRDASSVGYNQGKAHQVWASQHTQQGAAPDNGALRHQIHVGMNIASSGRTPIKQLGDKFNENVQVAVRSVVEGSIQPTEDTPQAEVLLFTYLQARDSQVDDYNDNLKQCKEGRNVLVFGTVTKEKIYGGSKDIEDPSLTEQDKHEILVEAIKNEAFSTDFLRALSPMKASLLIPKRFLQDGGRWDKMSWGDFIMSLAVQETYDISDIRAYDPMLADFIDENVKSTRRSPNREDKAALAYARNFDGSSSVRARYTKANGELAESDVQAMLNQGEAIARLVVPECGIRMGLVDIIAYMSNDPTSIGYKWTFGTAEQKVSIAIGCNFVGMFLPFLDFFADNPDGQLPANLKDKLDEVAELSVVHKYIADQLVELKTAPGLLTQLADPDLGYNAKNKLLNDMFGSEDAMIKDGAWSISRRKPADWGSSESDDSAISWLAQGATSVSMYKKTLIDNARKEVGTFFTNYDQYLRPNSVTLWQILTTAANQSLIAPDFDSISVLFSAIAGYSSEQFEKGKAVEAAIHAANAFQYSRYGSRTSYLSDMTNEPFDIHDLDNFVQNPYNILNMMVDPSFYAEVTDEKTQEVLLSNYIDFWTEMCERAEVVFDPSKEPPEAAIRKMLEDFPAVYTMLGGLTLSQTDMQGAATDTVTRGSLTALDTAWALYASRSDNKVKFMLDHQTNLLKMERDLWSQGWFVFMVWGALDEETKERARHEMYIDPSKIREVSDRIVRSLYASYCLGSTGVDLVKSREDRAAVVTPRIRKSFDKEYYKALDGLTDLLDGRILSNTANFEGAVREQISYAAGAQLLANLMEDAVKASNNGQLPVSYTPYTLPSSKIATGGSGIVDRAVEDYVALSEVLLIHSMAQGQATVLELVRANKSLAIAQWRGQGFSETEAQQLYDEMEKRAKSTSQFYDSLGDQYHLLTRPMLDSMRFETRVDKKGKTYQVRKVKAQAIAEFEKYLDDLSTFLGSNNWPEKRENLVRRFSLLVGRRSGHSIEDFQEIQETISEMIIMHFACKYDFNGQGINPDYYSMRDQVVDGVRDFLSQPHPDIIVQTGAMDPRNSDYNYPAMEAEMPNINLTDRYDAIICQRIAEAMQSGSVPEDINLNGGDVKWIEGINLVDEGHSISELGWQGQAISYKDLYALYEEAQRKHRTAAFMLHKVTRVTGGMVGATPSTRTIREIFAELEQNKDSDDVVYAYYDPRFNPHGVYQEAAPAVLSPDWLVPTFQRLAAAIAEATCTFQEALVLKSRKGFDIRNLRIVRKKEGAGYRIKDDKIPGAGTVDLCTYVRNAYMNVVEEMATAMQSSWPGGQLKSTLSFNDFVLFAQAMVVSVRVSFDEKGNDTAYIDVTKLGDSANFDSKLQEEIAKRNGKAPVTFSFQALPLRTVSQRIMQSVAVLNSSANDTEVRNTAYLAMTNWNSTPDKDPQTQQNIAEAYVPNRMKYADVLQRLVPYANPRPNSLLDSKNLTPELKKIKEEFEKRGFRFSPTSRYAKENGIPRIRVIEHGEEANQLWDKQNNLNNIFIASNGNQQIVKVFANSGSFDDVALKDLSQIARKAALDDRMGNAILKQTEANPKQKTVLVLDQKLLADAALWALGAQAEGIDVKLLIPSELIKSGDLENLVASTDVKMPSKQSTSKSLQFPCVLLSASQYKHFLDHRQYATTGVVDNVDSRFIVRILLDEDRKIGGEDPTIHMGRGVLSRLKSRHLSKFNFSLTDFTPNVAKGEAQKNPWDWAFDMCDDAEVQTLAAAISTNVPGWESSDAWDDFSDSLKKLSSKRGGSKDIESTKNAVATYLANTTSVRSGIVNADAGDCVGIMKYYHKSTGEKYYIPILVPKGVRHIDTGVLNWNENTGEILVNYVHDFELLRDDVYGFIKLSGMSMASDKAMTILDEILTDEELKYIDGWQSYDAVSGRYQGREDIRFYVSAEYAMIREKIHFLLEPDMTAGGQTAVCRYRKEFQDWFNTYPNSESNTLHGRFDQGSHSIWSALAAGEDFGIFTAEQMNVIQTVLERCAENNINPMTVFGAAQWKTLGDGSILVSNEQVIGAYDLAFHDLGNLQLANFFSACSSRLCENPESPGKDPSDQDAPIFNSFGQTRTILDGEWKYRMVVWDRATDLGHESEDEGAGGQAAPSAQHVVLKTALYGVTPTNASFSQQYSAFLTGDFSRLENLGQWRSQNTIGIYDSIQGEDVHKSFLGTWLSNKYRNDIREMAQNIPNFYRTIVEDQDKSKPIVLSWSSDNNEHAKLKAAITEFCRVLGFRYNEEFDPSKFDLRILGQILNSYDGATPPTDREGAGSITTVTESYVANALQNMADNFRNTGLLISPDASEFNRKNNQGRLRNPLLLPGVQQYLQAYCDNYHYTDYQQKMFEQVQEVADIIQTINDSAKRQELRKMFQAYLLLNNRYEAYDFGDIWAGFDVIDLAKSDEFFRTYFESQGFDFATMEAYQKQCQDTIKEIAAKASHRDEIEMADTGTHSIWRTNIGKSEMRGKDSFEKVLDNLVNASRAASVMSLGVLVSNPAGRLIGQTAMEIGLKFAENGNGPFVGTKRFSKTGMQRILNDPTFDRVFKLFRKAGAFGMDVDLLAQNETADKIEKAINEFESESQSGLIKSLMTKVFDAANGFNIGVQQQERLFLTRFLNFVETTPELSHYLEINPQTGNMWLEDEFVSNPADFFVKCFAKSGHAQFYVAARLGLNSARIGDLAQDHWLATLLYDLAQEHPYGRFLFNTTVCKFPRYAFNAMDRVLNWALPMSAINYCLTAAAAKIDESVGGNHHLELTQKYASLGEAFMVDAVHMGTSTALAILVCLAEGIEPPEDPKHWNNPDEWLIGGQRLAESWWTSDVCGILLPYTLAIKAAVLGHPEASLPLMLNSALELCYSNPIMRTGDFLNVITNWVEGDWDDWDTAKERYADTPAGSPGFWDWANVQVQTRGATWVANMFLPAFLKELYKNMPEEERSYNRVYETAPSGALTEAGMNGKTVKANYEEAMWRKAAQQSPFLAIILDAFRDSKTGYTITKQPKTVWSDSYQLESIDEWDKKTAEDKAAAMTELITIFSTTPLDELEKKGFFLSYDVLYAFGAYLWDSYYDMKSNWEQMDAKGLLDPTYLGNGDKDLGWQKRNELYANYQKGLRSISDMYYKVVKNSYLSKGIQQYNMYNTTWARDMDGNFYATGIRPQGLFPFRVAPGTAYAAEGTAGYENDFMSVSAVTGEPLDQRALVPIPKQSYDMPAFETYSKDGKGNGYSGMWDVVYKPLTKSQSDVGTDMFGNPISEEDIEAARNATTTPKYYTSGGGGGGYSRRYSSSPSSYVPGISSRNYSTGAPNAAVARGSNFYNPQFDYLRPNVETKGSRDAYKRGDI